MTGSNTESGSSGSQPVPDGGRYVLARIPFGKHHASALGRLLYVYYRAMHGLIFAMLMFGIVYWDAWTRIDGRIHILVFALLMLAGMQESTYTRDRKIYEYVKARLNSGDSDD